MAQNDTFVFIDVRSIPSSDVIFNQNLSVCPSVKRMDCDKTKESCAHTLISHERPFILALWQEEWLVWGDPFHLKFLAKLTLS